MIEELTAVHVYLNNRSERNGNICSSYNHTSFQVLLVALELSNELISDWKNKIYKKTLRLD